MMKKTTKTPAPLAPPTPAAAPAAVEKSNTFQTPHKQQAAVPPVADAKPATPKGKGKAKPSAKAKPTKATAPKAATPAKRDAFNGIIGTRMSQINLVVINAGEKGATVPEVATETGESASLVSAQLSWMVSHKKVATRQEETDAAGKKLFRYFAKS